MYTVATEASTHRGTAERRLFVWPALPKYSLGCRTFSAKYNSQSSTKPSGIVLFSILHSHLVPPFSRCQEYKWRPPGQFLLCISSKFSMCYNSYCVANIMRKVLSYCLPMELSQAKVCACSPQTLQARLHLLSVSD